MTARATIFADEFDEDAVDRLSARCNRMIDEDLGMQRPILCVLYDAEGLELARFVLGTNAPTEESCDAIEAELRSQRGASMRMTDRNGVIGEVMLVIGAGTLQ